MTSVCTQAHTHTPMQNKSSHFAWIHLASEENHPDKATSPLAVLELMLEPSADLERLEFIFSWQTIGFSKRKNKIQKDIHITSWRSNDS